jgi:hypothetical protein
MGIVACQACSSSKAQKGTVCARRWLSGVWLLAAGAQDGIAAFGPLLIQRMLGPPSSWAIVQAALLSAVPFGLAAVIMLVRKSPGLHAGAAPHLMK